MADSETPKKSFIEWKVFVGPFLGVIVTALWGVVAMHFGVKELTNVVTALRETVVDLRTTVNEMGRHTTDHAREISLLQFRMGTVESQVQLMNTAKAGKGKD